MMSKKEGKIGPWFWKSSVQQYRRVPEQGRGKGWMGEQGEGIGLMGFVGRGDQGKGKSFEM